MYSDEKFHLLDSWQHQVSSLTALIKFEHDFIFILLVETEKQKKINSLRLRLNSKLQLKKKNYFPRFPNSTVWRNENQRVNRKLPRKNHNYQGHFSILILEIDGTQDLLEFFNWQFGRISRLNNRNIGWYCILNWTNCDFVH